MATNAALNERRLGSESAEVLGGLRRVALAASLVVALSATSDADTANSLAHLATEARVEAHKWRADAELVQVELLAFDFGMGPSGYPDVSKTGPPRGALFHFLSPSTHQGLRVLADMSRGTWRAEPLSAPSSPFTRSIPTDVSLNFEQAIAQAKTTLGNECTGGDPLTSSCGVVTGAELHIETGGSSLSSGTPVWTVHFGQNPRTLRDVSRAVEARTGRLIASQSNQPGPDEATGRIPALHATVVGLRFFVSYQQPTAHQYDNLFFYNAAQYIYWELDLVHPAPGHQAPFTLEEVWKGPSGDVIWRAERRFTVGVDWTESSFWSGARLAGTKTVDMPNQFYSECLRRQREREGFGSCSQTSGVDIEQWQRGTYEVDILVDKRLVATGVFRMDEKDHIYGEVQAKAADRSAPVGVIRALDAKVTALRFFESGATLPPTAGRRYTTRFPLPTTRFVVWELDLAHPAPGRWLPVPIEALLFFRDAAGERVIQRRVFQTAAPADRSDTYHMDFFGWEDDYYYGRAGSTTQSPRRWLPGSYRVDLYVADVKVASGSFEIR
jgi:hypothetical protein